MTGLLISADPNDYMRRDFIESRVFTYLEPYIMGVDLLPKVNANGRSFTYRSEKSSMASSTDKKTPKKATAVTEFPEIQISRLESSTGLLNRKGFKAVIDRDAINENLTDDVDRAFRFLAYSLAYDLNTEVFSTLYDGGTSSGVSYSDWSTATTNIVDEIRQTKNAMRRTGYAYKATDMYLNETQWEELEKYLFFTDYTDETQNRLMGWPVANGDTIRIPGVGIDVTRVDTGITAGNLLLLDKNNPAATLYYNIDPLFGSASISYETMVDGVKKMVSIPNFGLHINTYIENKSREFNIDAWVDYGIGMKEPYAAITGTGI